MYPVECPYAARALVPYTHTRLTCSASSFPLGHCGFLLSTSVALGLN